MFDDLEMMVSMKERNEKRMRMNHGANADRTDCEYIKLKLINLILSEFEVEFNFLNPKRFFSPRHPTLHKPFAALSLVNFRIPSFHVLRLRFLVRGSRG